MCFDISYAALICPDFVSPQAAKKSSSGPNAPASVAGNPGNTTHTSPASGEGDMPKVTEAQGAQDKRNPPLFPWVNGAQTRGTGIGNGPRTGAAGGAVGNSSSSTSVEKDKASSEAEAAAAAAAEKQQTKKATTTTGGGDRDHPDRGKRPAYVVPFWNRTNRIPGRKDGTDSRNGSRGDSSNKSPKRAIASAEVDRGCRGAKDGSEGGSDGKRLRREDGAMASSSFVRYQFRAGYTNAVRRPVRMRDLL